MPSLGMVAEMGSTGYAPQIALFGSGISPANDMRVAAQNRSDVTLTFASLANNAARQSDVIDFGSPRPPAYGLRSQLEFQATPGGSGTVVIAFSFAHSASGPFGAKLSTSDAAYSPATISVDEGIAMMAYRQSKTIPADTAVLQMDWPVFTPAARYAVAVIKNNGNGIAMVADGVEMHIVLEPILPEGQ